MTRPILRLALLCLVFVATIAEAHPYGVDDLLKLESLGRTELDPSGRWLVLETRAPYDSAARFDYDGHSEFALGRLSVVDLARPGPARPLFEAQPDTGYRAGPFSPSGRALVVYRRHDQGWEAGVVCVATGAVRWLGVAPDFPELGRGVQWRSETELDAILLGPGDRPLDVRMGGQGMQRLPALWERSAKGRLSAFTVVGSGRYRNDRPQSPPRSLVRIDLRTHRTRILAEGAFVDMETSPTGRFIAVLAAAEPLQPVTGEEVHIGDPDRRGELVVVDAITGQIRRPLGGRDVLWSLLSWSPAEDALLVFSRKPGASWSTGLFSRIDAADGAVRDLDGSGLQAEVERSSGVGFPAVHALWLGTEPALYARIGVDAASRPDWWRLTPKGAVDLTRGLPETPPGVAVSDKGELVLKAQGRVWRIDRAGHARSVRDANGSWPIAACPFAIGQRGATNPSFEDACVRQGLAEPPTAHQRPATGLTRQPVIQSRTLALSRFGPVVDALDDHGVQTISLMDSRSSAVGLLRLNQSLSNVEVAAPQPIRHRGPDGQAVTSWLYLPADHQAGKRWPLVVLLYPGAVYPTAPYSGRPDALALQLSPQVIAGHGYAVLVPSLPTLRDSKDPAAGVTSQLLTSVNAVIAAGYADPDRIALWGHSFGGYGALVAATQTSRFRAIIAEEGISDLVSFSGAFSIQNRVTPEDGLSINFAQGWAETGQGGMHAEPWTDAARYERNSPVFFAGQVSTPILLIHGDMDFLGLNQSEEMFSALWRQGKDAKLMTFWGEGHGPSSPANVRALYAEAFAFLKPRIGEGRPGP